MGTSQIGLIITLVLGIFILIGALIALIVKKKEKVVEFSIGLAFGVMIMLMITHLIPEVIEHLDIKYIYIFIIGTIIGYFILKILDKFIPDHDDEDEKLTKKELNDNLVHIGIVTSLALVLHNIIEGMAVYSTILTDVHLGIAMALGIGFHNIPLGMVIAGAFHQSNQNISKTILSVLFVSLSTFTGGIIMFLLNLQSINVIILGLLLSITLGILVFITFNELLPRIKATKTKKATLIGITIGVLIQIISLFVHIH